ncbi:MAG: aldolase/citrate lyase family protein [Chitinophagaceae bacterium]
MKKNKLKEVLNNGGTVSNGWLHIPNSWTAEVMAHAGWNSITVDMQHGLMGIETAIQMMQAISTSDAVPMARVPWNDPGQIMRLLDGGAYAIICPMINSAADCENFVRACKYPPEGIRSFGPTRARVYAGMDYADYANEEIMTFAMIETKESMDNIGEILSVKGLDAVFVGSGDLKLSLTGKAGHSTNSPLFDDAIDKILSFCAKHQVIPGIWCANIEDAKKMRDMGFRFIAVKSDSMMLTESAKQIVNTLKN